MITPLGVASCFYVASYMVIKYHIMLSHNFNYVAGCESTIHIY